jgi:hypothetical protein
MEPEWTKAIQSETVCNFFYFFFVVNATIAVISILVILYTLSATSIPKAMVLPLVLQGLLPMAIAITGTLFNYLVCSRALLRQA